MNEYLCEIRVKAYVTLICPCAQVAYIINRIISKLTDLGWGEEIEIMNSAPTWSQLLSHDLVDQPKELVNSGEFMKTLDRCDLFLTRSYQHGTRSGQSS